MGFLSFYALGVHHFKPEKEKASHLNIISQKLQIRRSLQQETACAVGTIGIIH